MWSRGRGCVGFLMLSLPSSVRNCCCAYEREREFERQLQSVPYSFQGIVRSVYSLVLTTTLFARSAAFHGHIIYDKCCCAVNICGVDVMDSRSTYFRL